MVLSILIPTVNGRETEYERLLAELKRQFDPYHAEIVTLKDDKTISIGEKRQKLLDIAKGEYCVMIDDDDMVAPGYADKIMQALQSKPDCIGYLESVLLNDVEQIACHSDRWQEWRNRFGGYDYVRTIFYKDVIKTDIAKKIGFKDMRFAEDHDFSIRLKQSGLLKTEVFINEVMYYYTARTLSPEQHKQRYGIK